VQAQIHPALAVDHVQDRRAQRGRLVDAPGRAQDTHELDDERMIDGRGQAQRTPQRLLSRAESARVGGGPCRSQKQRGGVGDAAALGVELGSLRQSIDVDRAAIERRRGPVRECRLFGREQLRQDGVAGKRVPPT